MAAQHPGKRFLKWASLFYAVLALAVLIVANLPLKADLPGQAIETARYFFLLMCVLVVPAFLLARLTWKEREGMNRGARILGFLPFVLLASLVFFIGSCGGYLLLRQAIPGDESLPPKPIEGWDLLYVPSSTTPTPASD